MTPKVKIFLALITLCLAFQKVKAQDVIVKKDGTTILSKVLEVNAENLKYKKFKNLQGPTYSMSLSEIISVNYENGEKDTFGKIDNSINESSNQMTSTKLIEKPADGRNQDLISVYNRNYKLNSKEKKTDDYAKGCVLVFGVKSNSIMSNEDLEMKFVRTKFERTKYDGYFIYNINIKNKTDRTIYIDKGNCFRIGKTGDVYCYFDNTEQTTVNSGGSTGGSLGLGSVAGVLGIGGVVGQLANGVSIGGESSHSVSKTYSQQRVIAIPPHGNRNMTEEKWVEVNKTYERWGKAELFEYNPCVWPHNEDDLGLKRGIVKRGESITFSENNSPYKREYLITYSTDEYFSSYSTLKAEIYLHQIFGVFAYYFKPEDKYIDGIDENTIVGRYELKK